MKNDEIDYLLELAHQTGAACTSVSDGHIIILKKEKLRSLLEDKSSSELITIFVKKSDKNTNN